MLQTNLDHLAVEARSEIMAGALAYHALKTEHHAYDNWIKVGKAIVQLRRAAAAEAGVDSNSLKHPAYRAAYKRLIRTPAAGELREIDTASTTHAAWLANNLANVEAWRATLADKERISLNHPTSIWRKHPDGRKAEQADAPIPMKRPGQAAQIDDATSRLHQVLDKAEQRIGPDLAEMFDLSPEHIEATVDNLIDIFGEDAVRRLSEALRLRYDFTAGLEEQALDKIGSQHDDGTMWVTQKWRKDHGIDEKTIEALVGEGKLLRHGAHPSQVQRISSPRSVGNIAQLRERVDPMVDSLINMLKQAVKHPVHDNPRVFLTEAQAIKVMIDRLTPTNADQSAEASHDPAFQQPLEKPERRRGTKALDDPTRPRKRTSAAKLLAEDRMLRGRN
jgi:hypothetical protein